jgi:hypothetical protein
VHVAGRGLLVITGSGHVGAVDIVPYARALTGVEHVHAVVGAVSLRTGRRFSPAVAATPRPESLFAWIVGLGAVVGVAIPLGGPDSGARRFGTALVDLVIGLCIFDARAFLLAGTTDRVLRGPWRAPAQYGQTQSDAR